MMHGGGAAAAQNFPMEEEKKDESDFDMSAFETNRCVYCMAEITNADQESGKVQMFLAEGCFPQFHVECFRIYAKK